METYVNMINELKGIDAITIEEVKRETEKDELLQKVIHAVKSNGTLKKDLDLDAYANVISELSVINGLLLRGKRLVMPKKKQKKVVDAAQEGHQGITKTKSFLRSRLWFPGMDAMVERMVRDCLACQVVTPQISRMPLKMTPLPGETMEKVSADFYGSLPTGEYLLLVTCKYSRYPFIEIVTSTAAKVVIPHFERIFSEFGIHLKSPLTMDRTTISFPRIQRVCCKVWVCSTKYYAWRTESKWTSGTVYEKHCQNDTNGSCR